MTAESIVKRLQEAGVSLRLTPDGRLFATPTDRMNADLRQLCKRHKTELIEFMQQAERTTNALIEAAMRACDAWNDTEQAREQMRRDCLQTPAHLRADLLAHLQASYQRKEHQ